MTNDCGHELQHEESRLVCGICEVAEQQRAQDKAWNAAIEAAARVLKEQHDGAVTECARTISEAHGHYWEGRKVMAALALFNIRSLKREAK